MAVEMKLSVAKRTQHGSTACRRLRREGRIPGVVYGHQQDPIPFAVEWEALAPVLKAGTRVVDLDVEGHVEKAMFRDIQWDTFGIAVQHIDLLQCIDPNEAASIVEVPVILKGIAAGALAGGILDHHLHSVTLECTPAIQIPDGITVKIAGIANRTGDSRQRMELPPNTTVKNEPETVVVQVKQPVEEEEAGAEAAEGGPTQPEIVGRKVKEEEEEGEEKKEKK